jgi:hypothetical protein
MKKDKKKSEEKVEDDSYYEVEMEINKEEEL